jgi:hypothetical protein
MNEYNSCVFAFKKNIQDRTKRQLKVVTDGYAHKHTHTCMCVCVYSCPARKCSVYVYVCVLQMCVLCRVPHTQV